MTERPLAQFTLSDGTTFLVEVEEPESSAVGRVALPSGRQVLQVQQTLEEALDKIKPIASKIITKFRSLNEPADEVEVKFGVKLTADAGAIFASVGSEVTYEITLKWARDKATNGQSS